MMVKLGMLVKTKIGPLPVLVILILVQMKSKCDCKYIKREIISSQKSAPFSSTDSFSNPKFFCSKKTNECTHRGAVCSSSCCTCKCREHIPNFYSLQKGCVSSTVINNEQDTKCHFQLADSASFVPTFSGYQDLYASNLQVGAKYASISEIMNSGVCKTEIIQYIDSNGIKKALFENNCSEIIGIRSKELANGQKSHMLSWTYTGNSDAAWQKMKGKLLQMKISCISYGSKKQKVSSCLLFKVAGRYNDALHFSLTKSLACPTTALPMTASSTTTSVPESLEPSTTNSTSPDLLPPATLQAFQTTKAKQFGQGRNQELTEKKDKEKGINSVVVGLIVGSVFLLAIVAVAFFVLLRKRYQRKRLLKNSSSQGRSAAGGQCWNNSSGGNRYEDWENGPDSNLYETVGNVFPVANGNYCFSKENLKAASFPGDTKVNSRPKMPKPRQRTQKNEYDYARPATLPQEGELSYPDVEQYADMSQGAASEKEPLFNEDRRYANLVDGTGVQEDSGKVDGRVYETVGQQGVAEATPLIVERYVQPQQEIEYANVHSQGPRC